MTRMVITEATRFLYDGLNLRMVQRRDDVVDWTCDRSKQSFSFTDAEMATMLGDDTASFQAAGDPPPATLLPDPKEVSSEELDEAKRKLAYVVDLRASGNRPTVADATAAIAKTAERIGETVPPSNRSVERWSGIVGFPDQDEPLDVYRLLARHSRKGNRTSRISEAQRTTIDAMIDRYYLRRPPISVKRLVQMVRDEIRVRNKELPLDRQMTIPGREAVDNVLALRDPFDVAVARRGRAWAQQQLAAVHRQPASQAPLDKVELDHTVADIFLIDDKGYPLGRPTIGYAIDRCTRMPLGLYIGFEPPSVLTVMQILKNAMLPKTYVTTLRESGKWDLKHDWQAWGVPRMLMLDRAMENLGHDLRSSAGELGIKELAFAATRTGRHKGTVERAFRDLNTRMLHEQKGTTFSNVVARDDYKSAENAVMTLTDFQKEVHRYFIDIFAQEKHSGLNDIPDRVWRMLIDKYPSARPRPLDQIVHLFTRTETRTLGRVGIALFNMEYTSPELHAMRMSPEFRKASPDRSVLVRYDPADISQLWVRIPHGQQRYLKVPVASNWAKYARGKSRWEHDVISAYHRIAVDAAFDPDGLAESHRKLLDNQDKAKATRTRTRKSNARLNGVGRTSPAGDDASTTPEGSVSSVTANKKRQPEAAIDTSPTPPPQLPPQSKRAPSRPGVRRLSSNGDL